jgi:hypothetical protein
MDGRFDLFEGARDEGLAPGEELGDGAGAALSGGNPLAGAFQRCYLALAIGVTLCAVALAAGTPLVAGPLIGVVAIVVLPAFVVLSFRLALALRDAPTSSRALHRARSLLLVPQALVGLLACVAGLLACVSIVMGFSRRTMPEGYAPWQLSSAPLVCFGGWRILRNAMASRQHLLVPRSPREP